MVIKGNEIIITKAINHPFENETVTPEMTIPNTLKIKGKLCPMAL